MKEAILRLSLQGWLFAHMPAGWSGKMSPAYLRAGADAILPAFYRSSSDGNLGSPTDGSGGRPDSSPVPPDASAWAGECLTLDIPEWNNFRGRSRSEGNVSSLWELLETGPVPARHYLTANCAGGVLRRAEKMKKPLPPVLEAALKGIVASAGGTAPSAPRP